MVGLSTADESTPCGKFAGLARRLAEPVFDAGRLDRMNRGEHAALIRIPLSDGELGTEADDSLVDRIEVAARAALGRKPLAGEWDGHEFGGGWAVIFCYGGDPHTLADRMIEALLPFELPSAATLALETKTPEGMKTIAVISLACMTADV